MGCISCISSQVYNKYGYHPCFVLHCGNYILLLYIHLKAAYSVTFDIFILKIMFLFFKNTVKILKFRYTFYLFRNN